MQFKSNDAVDFIAATVERYSAPVAYSSFGKDSMVLLDLVKRAGLKLPIVFHRLPFMKAKYEFADKVILDNDYTVYDYPPLFMGANKKNDTFELVGYHQMGKLVSYMPVGTEPPTDFDKPYLCGLQDIYNQPRGSYNYPWDLVLIGHKSSDVDPILGPIPLKAWIHSNEGLAPDIIFPIRDFTDKDIWDYTETHKLPISEKRYNRNNNWLEFEDRASNPDYFPVCTSCIDRTKPDKVFCPKLGKEIPNISSKIFYVPTVPPVTYYDSQG
jgi:hypothetical protein